MNSQLAITLTEALIALTIISILSIISLPTLQHFSRQADDKILLTQLLHAITFAQNEARSRGIPVVLCQSSDQKKCSGEWQDGQLIFADLNNDGVVTDKNQILAVLQIKARHGTVHWRSFPYYRNYLLFLTNGLTHSDNGTYWYCDADKMPVWAIVLNQSGKTRVVYPNAEHEILDAQGKALLC